MFFSLNRFGIGIVRALIFILAFELSGCGSILYPERNGQRAGGPLDVGVVILDGIGLFFFVIPGVIAYAVDFINHTIYLPHGRSSRKLVQIHIDGKMDQAAVEDALQKATGKSINLDQQEMKATRLNSTYELDAEFAKYRWNYDLALAK